MVRLLFLMVISCYGPGAGAQSSSKRILVLYENGGHHIEFSRAAKRWLDSLAPSNHLIIDYLNTTDTIDEKILSQYQLFFQLDYPPYAWKPAAAAAFEQYIKQGKGGWVGLHHATLLGEFDGYPMWNWFSGFMGAIRYRNYIASFVSANIRVEKSLHPVMRGLPKVFRVKTEEFYTYDQSPRGNVDVLANVDEDSYVPGSTIKMGDHPVIWSNTRYPARNVYIFMGHSPDLFENSTYKTLLLNAILWASSAR